MKSFTRKLVLEVPERMDFVNITPDVEEAVRESCVREGRARNFLFTHPMVVGARRGFKALGNLVLLEQLESRSRSRAWTWTSGRCSAAALHRPEVAQPQPPQTRKSDTPEAGDAVRHGALTKPWRGVHLGEAREMAGGRWEAKCGGGSRRRRRGRR